MCLLGCIPPASPTFGLQLDMLVPQQAQAESRWQAGLGKTGVPSALQLAPGLTPLQDMAGDCGQNYVSPPGAVRSAGVWSHHACFVAESVPRLPAHMLCCELSTHSL